MKMKTYKKGRTISGNSYVEADEKYDRKMERKQERSMKTAGLATALKKASKNKNKMNGPKIKASMKGC